MNTSQWKKLAILKVIEIKEISVYEKLIAFPIKIQLYNILVCNRRKTTVMSFLLLLINILSH